MTASIESEMAQYLDLADTITAQFAHYLHLSSQLTATAADETNTVTITLDSNGRITNVWIQPGCKRLGATTINQRLSNALQKACITLENTKTNIDADHTRKLAALQARNGRFIHQIDAGPLTSVPATPPPSHDTRLSTEAPTITVTSAALHENTETELATKIVAAAHFSTRAI
jgi:ESX secretion-associated protein EspL